MNVLSGCACRGGFPSGCSGAYSAMKKRLKKKKSPLPPFHDCAVMHDEHSQMSYDYNSAALVIKKKACKQYAIIHNKGKSCIEWETQPPEYIKGKTCSITNQGRFPPDCVGTYRYIDVFIDGKKAGDTYYWH